MLENDLLKTYIDTIIQIYNKTVVDIDGMNFLFDLYNFHD